MLDECIHIRLSALNHNPLRALMSSLCLLTILSDLMIIAIRVTLNLRM